MTNDLNDMNRRLSLGDSTNALTKLIAINLILFITLSLCKAYFYFFYQDLVALEARYREVILQWFLLPADPRSFITKPWTLLTFPFANLGIWMIIGNMLWLWAFGFIFQDLSGNRKIVPLYLYGAWAGGLTFILTAQFFPSILATGDYMGCSAAVMAIAIATTTLTPHYRLLPDLMGGIPLWVLTSFYVLMTLATKPLGQPISYLPLVAGGLIGFLFMTLIRKGIDVSEWMNRCVDWVNNLFNPSISKKRRIPLREQLFYQATRRPFKKTPHLTQTRVDEILDKISEKGLGALTEEEREILNRASKS